MTRTLRVVINQDCADPHSQACRAPGPYRASIHVETELHFKSPEQSSAPHSSSSQTQELKRRRIHHSEVCLWKPHPSQSRERRGEAAFSLNNTREGRKLMFSASKDQAGGCVWKIKRKQKVSDIWGHVGCFFSREEYPSKMRLLWTIYSFHFFSFFVDSTPIGFIVIYVQKFSSYQSTTLDSISWSSLIILSCIIPYYHPKWEQRFKYAWVVFFMFDDRLVFTA